jgi:addiction module HigA family antidote
MTKAKDIAVHPGEILREEFMKPLGISSNRLARELYISAPRVNDIVLERRSVTADTAVRLGIYFGTGPELWMNLQSAYDIRLAKAAKSLGSIKPLPREAFLDEESKVPDSSNGAPACANVSPWAPQRWYGRLRALIPPRAPG